jgi:hypothetical protein
MPAAILSLFEPRAWPVAAIGPAAKKPLAGVKIDIAARMRGMWR